MKRLHIIAFCAFLLTSLAAHAAITQQIQAQASQLMNQGKAAQAYALLRKHHAPGTAGAQEWFLLGVAAYRARDLTAAEGAFRQTLAFDPGSQRAKLELARVLQERGVNPEAEQLFLDVRSQNPPAQVAANIDRFLSMLQNRNAQGHAYRARATVGAGYDSNVNQATKAQGVALFGLPFTLSRDARQRGDGFGFFKGEFDHIYRFDRNFAWATNLSFNARRNFSQNDYDSYGFYAASGPVLQPGERTTIMLPVFANISRYENSKLAAGKRFFSNEYGVAPQVRYALTETLSLNLATVLARRHYFEQSQRDATVVKAAPGLDIRTAAAGTFSVGLIAGREIAVASIYSNRSRGATVGWQYAFARNFVTSVYGSFEDIDYDAQEAMNDRIRRDRKMVAGLDAIYQSELLSGDIMFSFVHTWNDSNIPLYRYKRDVVSVGYRRSF